MHDYESVAQLRGSRDEGHTVGDPTAFERANYMATLHLLVVAPGARDHVGRAGSPVGDGPDRLEERAEPVEHLVGQRGERARVVGAARVQREVRRSPRRGSPGTWSATVGRLAPAREPVFSIATPSASIARRAQPVTTRVFGSRPTASHAPSRWRSRPERPPRPRSPC